MRFRPRTKFGADVIESLATSIEVCTRFGLSAYSFDDVAASFTTKLRVFAIFRPHANLGTDVASFLATSIDGSVTFLPCILVITCSGLATTCLSSRQSGFGYNNEF